MLSPQGLLPNRVVTLNSEGEIIDIAPGSKMDGHHGVEFYSGLLMPGMVNAHSHLELAYLKGAIEPRCGFAGFAAGMARSRGQFSMEQRLSAMDYRDAKMWYDGVQVVGDVSNGDSSLGVKSKSKIHYHTFLELFGLTTESTDNIEKLYADYLATGLSCSLTPHSTYSLNGAMFSRSVGLTPAASLSVHFMESNGELALYDKRGELWDWYEQCGFKIDFDNFGSPAERLISCVGADRKIMLVHNTMITPEDVEMLVDHFGDNLTFVLCPLSNSYITGQMAPVELLRRSGANIAVGTDSLASNTMLSMIDELKCYEDVPLEELLGWATHGGAQALGVDDRFGTMELGRRCGLVLVEGIDWSVRKLTAGATTKRLI